MRARTVYRLSTVSLSVLAGVNCFVAFRLWRVSSRPVNFELRYVEQAPLSFSPAPAPDSSLLPISKAAPASAASESVPLSPPRGYTASFRVFWVSGRPFARLNGVDYTIGDTHAYGVVRSIYPERVVFASGDYIDNIKQGGQNDSISSRSDSNNS